MIRDVIAVVLCYVMLCKTLTKCNLYCIMYSFVHSFIFILQEKAELAIQRALRAMCAAGGVWAFPDADNRHNVIRDKMCLCRFYEYKWLMR